MESSILQKYFTEQEKQRPLFSSSRSNIATIDEQYDQLTNRSDVLSSESFFRTDLQSNSRSSPSPSNTKIKEFCPTEEDEDDDDSSFKRRLAARLCCAKCKTCLIGLIIGGLLAAIGFSVMLAIYIKDNTTTTTTSTTSTSSTSTTSTSSTSSTSTTSTTTSTSTSSSTSSTSSTSTTSTTTSTSSSTSSTSSTSTTTSTSSSTSSTSSTSETTSTTTSTTTSSETTTTTTETTTSLKVCPISSIIITFDDLTSAGTVSNGYKNINWTNAYANTAGSNTNGYYTGTVSSPYSIFNPYGNPLTMTSATGCPFTLSSLAVAAAWNDNLQLKVDGYSSNVIIVSNTYTLQVFTVSYLTFSGYSGLDSVKFTSSGGTTNAGVGGSGTQFAMDNINLSF